MARRKRTPRNPATAATADGGSGVRVVALSGFDAANPSPRRGYVTWPSLDGAKAMGRGTRLKLLRLSRWCYANVGLAARMVDGVADLVGYLTPQAATRDAAWNAAAEQLFRDQCDANIFDRAGKLSFFDWQRELVRCRMRDGDSLTVLTSTSTGIGRVVFYEAHQVDDGTTNDNATIDGVYVDNGGRNAAYRVVDADDPARYRKIDAGAAIFFANFQQTGSVRGCPGLAHAANHIIDIVEITADWKHAIKVAAQIGLVLEKAPGTNARPARGLTGSLVKSDDGSGTNLLSESLWQGGQVPQLAPGENARILQDSRPHPNALELVGDLTRNIAWGTKFPPEVLWNAAGLTGPGTRFVMALTRRAVSGEQLKLRAACQRFWIHWLSRAFERGDLAMPSDPRWWACAWIPQADPTIDIGREGALSLEQLKAGASTLSDIWAGAGSDWETKLAQRDVEIRRAHELAAAGGYPVERLLGPMGSSAVLPVDTTNPTNE